MSQSESKPNPWRLRDPVHGLIVLGDRKDNFLNETDRIAIRLIDTREFQRLRRIRHLGFSELVYPGATHTRFIHSVGVYHIACQLMERIRRKQEGKQEEFCEAQAQVALLAALLHDIGHGPFSHSFEHIYKETELYDDRQDFDSLGGLFLTRPDIDHEYWSAKIVENKTTAIWEVLSDKKYQENLPNKIALTLRREEPTNIYDSVVSSQFDADRLDYLQRDRLMSGVECGHIDFDWLIDSIDIRSMGLRSSKDDGSKTDEQNELGKVDCLYLNHKGLIVAEEYLESRFHLYKTIYMHKTTRGVEKMVRRLLLLGARDLQKDDSMNKLPLIKFLISRKEPSLSSYLKLDDAQVWSTIAALASLDRRRYPEIVDLAKSLQERDIYKSVAEYEVSESEYEESEPEYEESKSKNPVPPFDTSPKGKVVQIYEGIKIVNRVLEEKNLSKFRVNINEFNLLYDSLKVKSYEWYNPALLHEYLVVVVVFFRLRFSLFGWRCCMNHVSGMLVECCFLFSCFFRSAPIGVCPDGSFD